MWNPLKLIGSLLSIIPSIKDLWYLIKKDVPRVPCPNCKNAEGVSTGKVSVIRQVDGKDTAVIIPCPICGGSGVVRVTDIAPGK
jgi:endogenous inhibitor of DNA gyrase (YacG/DUF329 family)